MIKVNTHQPRWVRPFKARDAGDFPTTKGYAHMVVGFHKGWEVRRIAGGPGARVDCPTFYGVKVSRHLNRPIETSTFSTVPQVRRSIDVYEEKFQER